MATLEVHDGRGRVERVRLTPEEPVLFGASPACAIVLDAQGVAPVHGRIRWQKRRYKVDAGADVDAIEVNGKRVKSSTLYQGDEIRVGPCRIFVISTEDRDLAPPADDKTAVHPAPRAFAPGSGPSAVTSPTAVFEAPAFSDVFDTPGRSRRKKKAKRDRTAELAGALPDVATAPPPKRGLWARVVAGVVRGEEAAPGEERILRSPIVIGLGVTLLILLVASVGLYRVITRTAAERQYAKAFESLDDGDYRNAVKGLDAFLAQNPNDARANKARVFLALAKVRQFTSSSGASWENAFQAAQAMVSEVGEIEEYRDSSTELAEQLVKAVEGLAEKARTAADPEALREAEAALALEVRVAGKASDNLLGRSRALPKLEQAREAIRRAQTRAAAFAAIDAALASGSAEKAYEGRDRLVAAYPDMAADRELVARLLKANDLIRKGASYDPSGRPGEPEPNPDPLGPPTTLVLRLDPGGKPSSGPVVYALVDGLAFGLDGATGAPLWQVPVGPSAPFPPQAIGGGDPSVLVVDARYDELVRLDGRRGKLAWRQELGEPVTDPPLVLGNQVYQATPSGKILVIDLASGALRGTLNLGRRLARSPVGDESGQHLYVMGEEDTLFILDRDPLACASVEYLGHEPGSIGAAPVRIGRFLVVPENTGIDQGRLRVFVLDESGGSMAPRQTLPVVGWTWQAPATIGQVLWSSSDRGEVVAYSIGLYEAPEPFKAIASLGAENRSSGPAFALARSERELWLGSGRSGRYELNSQTGKLSAAWGIGQAGPAAAPVQVAGKLAVLTQQSPDGPGVALWGLDAQGGSVAWRTTLGAPWPAAVVPGREDGSLETLGFDGERLTIPRDRVEAGGFVEQPLPRAGLFRIPSEGTSWFTSGDATVLVPSPTASHLLVRRGGEPYKAVDLPSPLGARPIPWGADVLIPGADGRVYLINPATGESAADPFVPKFDRTRASRWRAPAVLDGGAVALADESGLIRRLVRAEAPRPRLVVTGELNLGKPLASDPASTGSALLVATVDGKVRSLAARDLSPLSTTDLAATRTLGPVAVAGLGFVGDSGGEVIAFSTDGRRLWLARLASSVDVAPAVSGGSAQFLTKSGTLVTRGLAEGSATEQRTLGVLPAGAPIAAGETLIVPTGLGSFRPLQHDRPKATVPKAGG